MLIWEAGCDELRGTEDCVAAERDRDVALAVAIDLGEEEENGGGDGDRDKVEAKGSRNEIAPDRLERRREGPDQAMDVTVSLIFTPLPLMLLCVPVLVCLHVSRVCVWELDTIIGEDPGSRRTRTRTLCVVRIPIPRGPSILPFLLFIFPFVLLLPVIVLV